MRSAHDVGAESFSKRFEVIIPPLRDGRTNPREHKEGRLIVHEMEYLQQM